MKGPAGSPAAIAARAWSWSRLTTALISELRASTAAIAASSTSVGPTSRRRSRPASPVPSCRANSSGFIDLRGGVSDILDIVGHERAAVACESL